MDSPNIAQITRRDCALHFAAAHSHCIGGATHIDLHTIQADFFGHLKAGSF